MDNLYDILGIKKTATSEEIKKAYFVMAKKYHPDSSDKIEVQKFHEVNKAYQVLSSKKDRKAYDLTFFNEDSDSFLSNELPYCPVINLDNTVLNHRNRQKEEMKTFHRNLLISGVLKIIGFTLLMVFAGYLFHLIFTGDLYLNMFFGSIIGIIWSVNSNFNLKTFVHSSKLFNILNILGWILFIIPILYFFGILFI